MKTSRIVLGCFLATLGFLADGTSAQIIKEFSAGISAGAGPVGITAGPDGNLWFTEFDGKRIGRITPDGVVTEFSAGITGNPYRITAGPDGNLWFTETIGNRIGRITPDGVVAEFSAGIIGTPGGITAGPDGNLWFTEYFFTCSECFPHPPNRIGRITPNGVVTQFSAGITASLFGAGITAGPDGNLWFTVGRMIGRITPDGVVTEFSAGITAGPGDITAGPDGNLWFTESAGIGRITPDGVVTEFRAGISSGPAGITAGPDGNLWFTEPDMDQIGRITPDGVVTEFGHFKRSRRVGAVPVGITAGPDGNLWFAENLASRIGRITVCCSPVPPPMTTVVSSLNPSQLGQAIVLTASVAGNFPTGTVQFMDGETPLGSPVTLSGGGIAQFMTSSLARGKHEITAVYSGDGNNAPSTSAVLVQTVGRSRHRGG